MIDWEKQWELFAPNFSEGICWIALSPLQRFPLLPGPGFGDFSHPTTRLVLQFLQETEVENRQIVDIGSGSGILSLAAAHLGAFAVFGIDIDLEAVDHAKRNLSLQEEKGFFFLASVTFGLTLSPSFAPISSLVVCMNMIFGEQKIAWESQKKRLSRFQKMFTSGILVEQQEAYLQWVDSQGWECTEIKEEEGWLGFFLNRKE